MPCTLDFQDGVCVVTLPSGHLTYVDACDAGLFDSGSWYRIKRAKGRTSYVTRRRLNGSRGTEYLHRLIVMPPEGLQVDHIDGDGLNNRRSNLRVATKQQNNWNVKRDGRLKGVYPSGTRWAARINLNGKEIHLGVHATIEEAAHVYDAAAIHYFGEYACLNFPGSDPLPFIPRIKKPKSSRFSGVAKAGTRWMAYAKSGGKQIYLGVYETEEEAAVARQQFDRSPEEGKRG